MTKKAMKEFLNSEFYSEIYCTVKAWDYYLYMGEDKLAYEMMSNWRIAKLALKHITGKYYGFSRDGKGKFSLVNENDYSDILFEGNNKY